MKKCVGLVCVLLLSGFVFSQQAVPNARTDDPLGVAVSPQLLILDKVQSGAVTVHTSIPYRSVSRGTVELNGISASVTYSDSCGNLVAKFKETTVKSVVVVRSTELTLTGAYLNGGTFLGSDTVQVR